jgi:hypothetical protein
MQQCVQRGGVEWMPRLCFGEMMELSSLRLLTVESIRTVRS